MVKNKTKVNGASLNLSEVAKLKSIDELKALEIFPEDADASNQKVWDAAQEFKAKAEPPNKVEPPKQTKSK